MWEPTDYILRGEFCPLPAIEQQLEVLRDALGARLLVHLALDHELVMRSMCFAKGEPSDQVEVLNQVLQTSDYWRAHLAFSELCVRVTQAAGARRWWAIPDAFTHDLYGLTVDMLRRSGRASRPGEFLVGRSLYGTYVSNTGRDDVKPRDGEVRSILLTDRPDTTARLHEGTVDYDHIGAGLKCTTHANTRRDAVVTTQVGQRLLQASSVPDVGDRRIADIADDALGIALEITASDAGAIYLVSTSQNQAHRRIAHRDAEGSEYPDEISSNTPSALSWAIDRHRAIQVPPGGPGPNRKRRTNAARHGIELITPIAGPLASPASPAVGALSVYRRQASGSFSAYDLALLGNLSLRLALLRTTSATTELADAIASLRTKPRTPLDLDEVTLDERIPAPLPKDVVLSLARFDDPLRQLANSTNSHAVSVRLALPAPAASDDHGLALWRVAAYPASRLDDERPILYEDVGGISWIVVREGHMEYVPDTGDDDRYVASHSGTRSELCVPVRVEGQLAGVLNLESTILDNYAPLLPLVVAFSGALGRTLADATSFFTQDVLDRAAISISVRHEIDHLVDRLETELYNRPMPPESQLLLEDFVAATRSKLVEIRQPPRRPQVESKSFADVLRSTVDDSDLVLEVPDPPNNIGFQSPLNPQQTHAMAVTLENLLHNMINYSMGAAYEAGEPTRSIGYGDARLDGHDYAAVQLFNHCNSYVAEERAIELYRYPLHVSSGQIRLGAFIAGLNARRAGARVHSTVLDDGRIMRTTVLVPVSES